MSGSCCSTQGASKWQSDAIACSACSPNPRNERQRPSYVPVESGDDVDDEPGACDGDRPSMAVISEGVSPDFSLIEFGDITAVLAGPRCALLPSPSAGASWGRRRRVQYGLAWAWCSSCMRMGTMRRATLGGVGICQCRARKVQPIELLGFSCRLLPSALASHGPALLALASRLV